MSKRAAIATKEPKKRARWTDEEKKLLVQQVESGEQVSAVARLFPQYDAKQIHSKISNLKHQGALKKIPISTLAPSVRHGNNQFFSVTYQKQRS